MGLSGVFHIAKRRVPVKPDRRNGAIFHVRTPGTLCRSLSPRASGLRAALDAGAGRRDVPSMRALVGFICVVLGMTAIQAQTPVMPRLRRVAPPPAPVAPDPAVQERIAATNQVLATQMAASRSNLVAAAVARDRALAKKYKEQESETDKRIVESLKSRVADGSADAAYDLAQRHLTGKSVPKDEAEARHLMALSAARGNEDAKIWLQTHAETPGLPTPAPLPSSAPVPTPVPKK